MTKEQLIEIIAEAIYHRRYQEIDEVVNQSFHKFWINPGYFVSKEYELAEHERDDFRYEAEAALDVVLANIENINELVIKSIIE